MTPNYDTWSEEEKRQAYFALCEEVDRLKRRPAPAWLEVMRELRDALAELAGKGMVSDAKGTWSKQVHEIATAALARAERLLSGAEPEPRFTAAQVREAFVAGCVQVARWENGEVGARAMEAPAREEALRLWPDAGKEERRG